MFLCRVMIPPISEYEVHQHLHHMFDAQDRRFLFYRIAHDAVVMLSIDRPKHPHREISLDGIPCGRPLSFSADLVITGAKNGRRYDIRPNSQRRQWLHYILGEHGTLLRFSEFRDGWMTLQNGVRRIVAKTTGVLEIVDRARFAVMLQMGIGRNRAYGCGMLYIPEIMS